MTAALTVSEEPAGTIHWYVCCMKYCTDPTAGCCFFIFMEEAVILNAVQNIFSHVGGPKKKIERDIPQIDWPCTVVKLSLSGRRQISHLQSETLIWKPLWKWFDSLSVQVDRLKLLHTQTANNLQCVCKVNEDIQAEAKADWYRLLILLPQQSQVFVGAPVPHSTAFSQVIRSF